MRIAGDNCCFRIKSLSRDSLLSAYVESVKQSYRARSCDLRIYVYVEKKIYARNGIVASLDF